MEDGVSCAGFVDERWKMEYDFLSQRRSYAVASVLEFDRYVRGHVVSV
jgi:outer membrane protein OmpA-like peptidoglycan-associated protein